MTEYTTNQTATTRVRWDLDTDYQTRGSYAYDTEAETKAAEDEEIAAIESGQFVVLGAIVETFCSKCNEWRERDSLWGIVIEPDEQKLEEFAEHSLDLTPDEDPQDPSGSTIGKVLMLSTANVPQNAFENGIGARFSETSYGWIVWPHRQLDTAIPEWLRPIIDRANDLGCSMIEFDQANDIDQALTVYDW